MEAPESGPVETDYIITTYTGKKAGAGTDANVIITITGEEGESGPHKLDKKGDNFEKGQYVLYSGFYHNYEKNVYLTMEMIGQLSYNKILSIRIVMKPTNSSTY